MVIILVQVQEMERTGQEDVIDLRKLFAIISNRRKLFGGIVAGFTAVALIISLLLPKEYTAQVTIQVARSGVDTDGATATMADIAGAIMKNGKAATCMELMKTRMVLEPIIEQVFDDIEPEKRPDAEAFAKKHLNIANAKGTQLISVEAKGRTPEEARYIAENVVNNFLDLMVSLNKENKSLVVSFLDERIAAARKEADDAALALKNYINKHEVYSSDGENNAQLKKMYAYDKTIEDIQVERIVGMAKLRSIAAQLDQQDIDNGKFSMMDDTGVQKIRNLIIDKDVELVKLRSMYQEEHLCVVQAKNEMAELKKQLSAEVIRAISSRIFSSSDNEKALQMARYQVATAIAVADASEDNIKSLQNKAAEDMVSMADDIIAYPKLAREAKVKQEIYNNLTGQVEEAKVRQTMESMDIQVVDPASLPDKEKPSGPRKKLITLAGMALGCMVSLGYSLVLYKREY